METKSIQNESAVKEACRCPDCEKRAEEHKLAEEFGLAVLVALMPVLTLTLFGNIGLL